MLILLIVLGLLLYTFIGVVLSVIAGWEVSKHPLEIFFWPVIWLTVGIIALIEGMEALVLRLSDRVKEIRGGGDRKPNE